MENVYQKLAEHLDRLPGGFTPSRTGTEIRLLEGLFTPEEAKLAVLLTLEQEDSATVAAKANISEDAVKIMLEEMARKGLIFSVRHKEEKMLYQAAPWVIGIYEFQVNRLTVDFLRNIDDYWSSIKDREEPKTISQMRINPINESIDTRLGILPYENVIPLSRSCRWGCSRRPLQAAWAMRLAGCTNPQTGG